MDVVRDLDGKLLGNKDIKGDNCQQKSDKGQGGTLFCRRRSDVVGTLPITQVNALKKKTVPPFVELRDAATVRLAQPAPIQVPAEEAVDQGPKDERTPKKRQQSLDALRGLTILLMLLVNNIALDTRTPAQLVHAPWNGGVHLADLVFPWFLLCMGLAVPFSEEGMLSRGTSWWPRLSRILFRSA